MANARTALAALGDPTRQRMMERLRGGPCSVGELVTTVAVSQPAVSQHLKILKEAGLVFDTAEGTRRIYRIDPKGLGPLRAWLDQFWTDALTAFSEKADAEAEAIHKAEKKK